MDLQEECGSEPRIADSTVDMTMPDDGTAAAAVDVVHGMARAVSEYTQTF